MSVSPFTPQAPTNFDSTNHLIIQSSAYDGAGNQKQIGATGGYAFTYDAENRLTGAYQSAGTTPISSTGYVYDGDGRRVEKITCPAATNPCNGSSAGASIAMYAYDAAGQLEAEYGATTETGTTYVMTDHLGSMRLVTDSSGAAVRCYDYLPFGEEIAANAAGRTAPCFTSTTDAGHMKFTGQERDAESGLDWFEARYFSSPQGRYTSPDEPLSDQKANDPQSWNLYAYARNNPLRFLDPTGRECVTLDGGGVGDNGIGATCQDKSLQTTHGVTVNGTTGDVTSGVFGNAVQMGDIDLSGGRDRIIGQTSEIVSTVTNVKALAGLAKVGLTLGPFVLAMAKSTPAEKLIIEELLAAGKTVEVVPTGTGRTADFLINGVPTELKTLTSAGPTTLKNAVQNAAKQGEQILIDARNVNMSPQEALSHVQRAQGNIGGLQGRVTVLTKGGTVTY